MPPTEIDLDRLEELAGAATPGPWKTNVTVFSERDVVITDWLKEGSHLVLADLSFECTYVGLTLEERRANARLIVALRNALPAILAKLREGERAEELNAASHDMLMKANARLTAERDALARALVSLDGSLTAAATPKEYYDGNGYAFRLRRDLREYHADALAIARRVAG
jgi:hypothetical protein